MELNAFLLPTTLATFSLAFAIVWRYGSKPALWWMIAYAAQCAAYLGEIVPTVFHRTIDTMLVDAVFVLGFVGFGQATALFFRWPRRPWLNLGLAAAICALDAWQIFAVDSLKGEILTVDWGLALLALVPFLANLRAAPATPVDRAMVAASVLTVLNCTVISSMFALFGAADASFDTYMSSGYVAWSYTVSTFLNVLVPLVQLTAVALRAIADHRDASEIDLLTGLLNRRGFERACARPGQPQRGFALACDIDHFKAVNDGFGHAVGDGVLVALAGAVRASLPEGAFAARFGGEEFVVFLPGADVDAAVFHANAMLSAFTAEVARALPIPHPVTASLGIAAVGALRSTVHADLQRADRALYAAKQAGRDRISVDSGAQGVEAARAAGERPALRIVA
ncbi:GGDEF domain-containing protein [Lichenibacterium dinghuense]|uniref:GGDEF domain-containing protein n=1 Tax=Lichenibacterium dinghuense TaxID=2895977 RepID=UPI001F39666F|nr:GGDEF domain-containing protein [Lichenibacterium sp. 6Y81]